MADTRSAGTLRKRVLLITRNFPPLVGGMERFNERVLAQLAKHFDVALCGPKGCEQHIPDFIPANSCATRPLARFVAGITWNGLRLSSHFRPNAVLAGSGLTAPMALLVARRLHIPVLVFLYGLDLVVDSWLYQRVWMSAIRACDGFLVISKHTRELAVSRGLDESRMRTVHPGVDPPLLIPGAAEEFRRKHGIGDRPLLLSVGRLTRRKGLVEFIEKCLPRVVESVPDVLLVVIGGEAIDALAGRTGGVGGAAKRAAETNGVSRNLLMLGRCSDETLASAYQASQLHVFPVLDIAGDVEGFGMVAIEAAAYGTPTVAFAVGGVPDAVDAGQSGTLVPPGDYGAMAQWIERYLRDPTRAHHNRDACIEFAHRFAWDRIGVTLTHGLRDLGGL